MPQFIPSQCLPLRPHRMLIALVACVSLCGCEFDRPNFQMNSNSPTPFFGFDLLPRRKTTSIVRPPVGQQLASAEVVSGEIEAVEEAPSRRRFLQRNAQLRDSQSTTIILPLTTTNPDQPLNRGPVELLR